MFSYRLYFSHYWQAMDMNIRHMSSSVASGCFARSYMIYLDCSVLSVYYAYSCASTWSFCWKLTVIIFLFLEDIKNFMNEEVDQETERILRRARRRKRRCCNPIIINWRYTLQLYITFFWCFRFVVVQALQSSFLPCEQFCLPPLTMMNCCNTTQVHSLHHG